ncbi:MAG TPA: 5-formyltetrahydrofolate cyclo-ligase [Sedimentisphaerales bacterium]|nr:5-formyltetrahydrofolate cyclo-ligase [Sedimentisphaerales bacterium]
MDKAELRRQLQDRLLAIQSEQRSEKSRKACRNLLSISEFQSASTVMMYLSLPHEADTSEAILHAWQLGKVVAVPKISWQQRHMMAVQIHSLETGFSTSSSGLRNPIAGLPMPFEEIDLVVTPALGFDRKGNRLGRGGSYYDRFFANAELNASRCGFGFAEQIIETIPVTEHDEPVDFLVTDEEIIYCKGPRKAGTR